MRISLVAAAWLAAVLLSTTACDHSERLTEVEAASNSQSSLLQEHATALEACGSIATELAELQKANAELQKKVDQMGALSVKTAQLENATGDLERRVEKTEAALKKGHFGAVTVEDLAIVDSSGSQIGRFSSNEEGYPVLYLGKTNSDSYAAMYFTEGSPMLEIARAEGLLKLSALEVGPSAYLHKDRKASIFLQVVKTPGTQPTDDAPGTTGFVTAKMELVGGEAAALSGSKRYWPRELRLMLSDSFGPSLSMSDERVLAADNLAAWMGQHLMLRADEDGPSLELSDKEMNVRSILGSTTIRHKRGGGEWKEKKRSPASLLFFKKDGTVSKDLGG